MPVLTTAVHMFMAIRLAPTALATLIKPFGEPFRVTPKGAAGRRSASDGITSGVALLLLLACLGGALRVPLGYLVGHEHRLAEVAVACALFESVLLLIVLLSMDRERPRAQDRFPFVGELMATPFAAAVRARLGELSLAGRRWRSTVLQRWPWLALSGSKSMASAWRMARPNGSTRPVPACNGPGSTRV